MPENEFHYRTTVEDEAKTPLDNQEAVRHVKSQKGKSKPRLGGGINPVDEEMKELTKNSAKETAQVESKPGIETQPVSQPVIEVSEPSSEILDTAEEEVVVPEIPKNIISPTAELKSAEIDAQEQELLQKNLELARALAVGEAQIQQVKSNVEAEMLLIKRKQELRRDPQANGLDALEVDAIINDSYTSEDLARFTRKMQLKKRVDEARDLGVHIPTRSTLRDVEKAITDLNARMQKNESNIVEPTETVSLTQPQIPGPPIVLVKRVPVTPEKAAESGPLVASEKNELIDGELVNPVEKTEPVIEEKKEQERKIFIAAELSNYVDAYARQEARRQWQELYGKSKLIRRMILHAGENYYVDVVLYNQIRESIERNRTLKTLLETRVAGGKVKVEKGEEESYRLTDAIIEAYEKDLGITEDEKLEKIEDRELDLKLGNIVYLSFKHDWKRGQFDEEVSALLGDIYKAKHKTSEHEGHVFASNIWNYVNHYRDEIKGRIEKTDPKEHADVKSFINGLMNLDLYIGKIDSDIKKEPKKLSAFENAPAWLQKNKLFGVVANPVVYGSAITLLSRAYAKGGLTKALTTATAAFMAPTTASFWVPLAAGAAVGGLYTGLRRRKEVTEDLTHARMELAAGRDVQGGHTKADITSFLLQMVDASERARELSSIKELDDASKELLADTYARQELEGKNGIQEMFRASKENADLDSRRLDLNKLYEVLKEIENRPGFTKTDLAQLIVDKKKSINDAIEENEKLLKSFKRGQFARSSVRGALMGIAGGVVTQELVWGAKAIGNSLGLNEIGDTYINKGVRRLITGDWNKHYLGVYEPEPGVERNIHLAPGFRLEDKGAGSFDYLYKDEVIVADLHMEGDGLDDASERKLQEKDFWIRQFIAETKIIPEVAEDIVTNQTTSLTEEELKTQFADVNWGTVDRSDWHDETGKHFSTYFNKPIEFEGKQQMLYLDKSADGSVVVNVKGILANIKENVQQDIGIFTNPDGTTDTAMSQEVDKWTTWTSGGLHKHMKVELMPIAGSPISAELQISEDGTAKLPESLSKLFTSDEMLRDGKLPFASIEVMSEDGDVLATARGEGTGFATTVEKVIDKVPKSLIQSDTYIIPPIYDEMEPGLPTPMAKRWPLETVEIARKRSEPEPNPEPQVKVDDEKRDVVIPEVLDAEAVEEKSNRAEVLPVIDIQKTKNDGLGEFVSETTLHDNERKVGFEEHKVESVGKLSVRAKLIEDAKRSIREALDKRDPLKRKWGFESRLTAIYYTLREVMGKQKGNDRFVKFMKEKFDLEYQKEWKFQRNHEGKVDVRIKDKTKVDQLHKLIQSNEKTVKEIDVELKQAQDELSEGKSPIKFFDRISKPFSKLHQSWNQFKVHISEGIKDQKDNT